ncbi:cupin domain-containing protein [Actinoplanes oblitus]|uniref:Cupin domain-containing protein n=1 Tax=Actinoplanes oblitus TaxID=3040509 RepID=A0ABY8W894_9ACTN|nr:cupin domain-containing protein [Actinoplanes oblitus]WIM93331.1 cupin domain-containing protein [Actinoplanes oblitus]
MTVLSQVVAVGRDAFAATYWGRQPLLSRAADLGGPDGFRGLLSAAAVDELLSRRGLRTPFLRVARQGKVLPAARYTGSGGAGAEISDQVHDEQVMRLYADGATLVLQGLHRLWPPIVDLAAGLGAELRRPLQVNAYLTPPDSQGFATHYDTHDVFVLQAEGEKRWCVHPPVLPDPLEEQPWGGRADEVAATAEGEPALDVVLRPGDALYLPRGWLHSARAQGSRSLHLTVGIRGLTRYALVEELLTAAAGDPRLRASLPYGKDLTDPETVAAELTATVDALRAWLPTADPVAIAGRLRERSWPQARPAPLSPLAQLDFAAALGPHDEVRVRPGLRWDLEQAGDEVILRLTGRSLRLPAYCEPALRLVLDGRPHRVGELPLADDDDRLVLVRRLLKEGITVPGE